MARNSYKLHDGLLESLAAPGSFVDEAYVDTGSVSPTAWTAVPTLQASWADVSGYQAAQYRVTSDGVVKLRGVIDSGTKTAATLLFTLPAGARPPAKTTVPVVSDVAAGVPSTLVIDTDGTVKIGTVTLTTACKISLEGLQFDINA